VKPNTLALLLRVRMIAPAGPTRFYGTPGCDVAYFNEVGQRTLPVSAVAAHLGQKETVGDRPICYCFWYSAADIASDPEGVAADIGGQREARGLRAEEGV